MSAAAAFGAEWTLHLIHVTLQGSAAAAVLLAVAAVVRRRSPEFRSALLGVALLKFVVPPMLPFATGVFSRFTAVPGGRLGAGAAAVFAAVAVLHASGAGVAFVRLARERGRVRRLRRDAVPAESPSLPDLARRFGLPYPPELLVSAEMPVPCAVGGVRPAILLPDAVFRSMPEPERDWILAHELAHLRRRDPGITAIESAVVALWWFNPLVRVLAAQRRERREESCDEEVLRRRGGDVRAYGRALLSAAALANGRRNSAVAATGRRTDLERRLRRLVGGVSAVRRRPGPALAIAGAALLFLPGVRPGSRPAGAAAVVRR
ncbi:MAG TPA: M56 family metallopeptidase [Thermoanaerobaculia bacterium]|nr:M56 family metallopeptidase [Thermoanaerobaculia bacterium]